MLISLLLISKTMNGIKLFKFNKSKEDERALCQTQLCLKIDRFYKIYNAQYIDKSFIYIIHKQIKQ